MPYSLTSLSVFVRACPCHSIPRPDRTGQGTHIASPSSRSKWIEIPIAKRAVPVIYSQTGRMASQQ